jgi:hypothetical protein
MPEQQIGKRVVRGAGKIFFWSLATGIGLLLIVTGLLLLQPVQSFIREQTIAYLERKLETTVMLEKAEIRIFRHLTVEGLYIEDHEGDTLLYAGHAAVRIRSINPLSKDIRIGAVELYQSTIHIYRHPGDSNFNYQFIADAFGSDAPKDTAQSEFDFDIGFKELNLQKVQLTYADSLTCNAYDIYLHSFRTSFNKFSLSEEILAINQLEASGCDVQMTRLIDTTPDTDTSTASYDIVHISPGDWVIEAGSLRFNQCYFGYNNENKRLKPGLLDFDHLALGDIDIDLEEIIYTGDTVTGYMNHIAFNDQSGFTLSKLQSAFLFSPYEITLNGLILETPQTLIQNQLSFHYTTLNDFNRFFDDVLMEVNLDNSHIATDDLAYFSNSLDNYHAQIGISALLKGRVSSIKSRGALLRINDAASMIADINIKGLPDIDETLFDIDFYPLTSDMPELDKLLGGNILPKQVTDLGSVNFNGKFTGFIYDFVLYGNTGSSIGKVLTDVRLQYNPESSTASYSGTIATEAFNAGILAQQTELLGNVSLVATVKGVSSPGKNEIVLSSQIGEIFLNGYNYRNINASGDLDNQGFAGRLRINDPNVEGTFDGYISLNDSIRDMNFNASILDADLEALNWYPDPLTVSADASIDIQGADINTFLGKASFTNIDLRNDQYRWKMDSLSLQSYMGQHGRSTSLTSDLINILVEGNYSIDQLPQQMTGMINYYLHGTAFMHDSMTIQEFNYNITGKNLHQISAIFYPELQQLDELQVSGYFNSGDLQLNSRLIAKHTRWNGYYTDNLAGELKDLQGDLTYFLRMSPLKINEQLTLPVTSAEGSVLTDSISLNLKMGKDTDPERLNLNAGIEVTDSLVDLHIFTSEIFVNNEKWDILPNNSLSYDYKNFLAENFTLTNGNRKVSISSSNKEGAGPALKVIIEHFDIADITTIAQYDDYQITGRIDANITVSNPFDSLTVLGFININELVFDGQKVGNINLTATRLYPNPRLNFNLLLKGDNSMRAYGYYYLGDTDSLNMVAEISKVPFLVAEPFTKGLMSNLSGDAYGNIKVQGPLSNLQTTGNIEMKNGGFTFDYLGTDMSFKFQKVELFPDRFYLTPNKLYDEFNNEGWIKGNIYHTNFDNFIFDSLQFTSGNFVLMDATSKENPDFYGYTTGKVDAVIDGPLDELNVTVNANPVKNDGKKNIVYIPAYGSGNVSRHNFIRFVDRSGTANNVGAEEKSLSVVNVNTFVEVTPDVEVQILLSSEGTDVIKGAGIGNLFIDVNTLGKVEISGLLKITEGSYDFSFEGLATKNFIVKEGGTILFDQDPYQAKLNLTAVYRLEKVQKLGLISDLPLSDAEIQEARKTIPVDVHINIGGTLEAPDISFDIILPDERGSGLSEFEQRLAEIKSDQNELNKQVFGLLMINKFLPKDINASSAIGAGVNSSISDFITSQLSGYFSDWISEIIPNAEIDIGYQKIGAGDLGLDAYDQTQFEAGLTQKLFSDALTVKIGGTYNYETTSSNPNANLAGDFEVEYRITPDGRIRVKAFRESDFDAVASKNDTRTGLGLFYTKDFDSFSELFGTRRKEEQEP